MDFLNKELKIEKISPFEFAGNSEFLGATLYSIDGKKNHLLRSRNGTSIIIDEKLCSDIRDKRISPELKTLLFARGFVDDFKRYNIRSLPPRPRFFMIDFTTKCNMNCYYCLRHFPDSGETILKEQLDRILNYIIAYCRKNSFSNISIQPWGGEPLLAVGKIFYMQEYLISSGINPDISIQTNGLLLSDELCLQLKEKKISIGVSIDGCEEIHNFHRKNWLDEETFKIVSNNIRILKKYYGENFGSISVNSKYSLPYIEKSLDVFAKEIGIRSIKMNLMHPNCDEFDLSSVISNDDLGEFIQRILIKILSLNKEGYRIFDSNIRDKIHNLLLGGCSELCHSDGCTGGYSSVTFSREGDIFPCELVGNEKVKLGNISEGKDLTELIQENITKNIYFKDKKKKECEGCDWQVYCRGGCTASCFSYNRKAGEVDEKECTINQYLYPTLIKLILCIPEAISCLANYQINLEE